MTDKKKEIGNELLARQHVGQNGACWNAAEKKSDSPVLARRRRSVVPESDCSEKMPAGVSRFFYENLNVKKQMARAMLEMGIAKKDVMEILNVVIK